jgi:hypothetical protein
MNTNEMAKIKLFEIKGLEDGTRRFQSQLRVDSGVADFIINPNEGIKVWEYGPGGGIGFYPFDGDYEIISNKDDMQIQPL